MKTTWGILATVAVGLAQVAVAAAAPTPVAGTPEAVSVAAASVLSAAPDSGATADAAAELTAAQTKLRDFTADFDLTVQGAAKNNGDFKAQGKLWLASGRRYRVQYVQPERQLLVSDGKQRWLYLEKINQVQIQALPPAGEANEFFLELGGGLPALIARCQVKRLPAEASGQLLYQLVPRPAEKLQFQQVKIWVGQEDKLPRRVVVLADRRVEARFTGIHANAGTVEGRFTFQPPKDAEVIDMLWPSK